MAPFPMDSPFTISSHYSISAMHDLVTQTLYKEMKFIRERFPLPQVHSSMPTMVVLHRDKGQKTGIKTRHLGWVESIQLLEVPPHPPGSACQETAIRGQICILNLGISLWNMGVGTGALRARSNAHTLKL